MIEQDSIPTIAQNLSESITALPQNNNNTITTIPSVHHAKALPYR
jgi:hypothetical protein